MKKLLLPLLATASIVGCSSVPMNGSEEKRDYYSIPDLSTTVTANVGDVMIEQRVTVTTPMLEIYTPIDGAYYDIPRGQYPQIGSENGRQFFATQSKQGGGINFNVLLADPPMSLVNEDDQVCVSTVMSQTASCYESDAKVKNVKTDSEQNFQQTIIYGGSVDSKINISYREFKGGMARDAFTHNVEYDMNKSRIINYKGAQFEVLSFDNTEITYKVHKHFLDNSSVETNGFASASF